MSIAPPGKPRRVFALVVTLILLAVVLPPLVIVKLLHWSLECALDNMEWAEDRCSRFTGWISGVPAYKDAKRAEERKARREAMLKELSSHADEDAP